MRSRGELVAGTVKKVTRDNVIVDLGNNAEGLLPREQLVGVKLSALTIACAPSSRKSALNPAALS